MGQWQSLESGGPLKPKSNSQILEAKTKAQRDECCAQQSWGNSVGRSLSQMHRPDFSVPTRGVTLRDSILLPEISHDGTEHLKAKTQDTGLGAHPKDTKIQLQATCPNTHTLGTIKLKPACGFIHPSE